MKKKFRLLVAAVSLGAVTATMLSGCAVSNQGSGSTTLKVLWDATYTKDSPSAGVVEKFEKDNPGVKVDIISAGTNLSQVEKTELVAGTAPDVMFGAENDAITFAQAGYLASLDSTPWAKKAAQAAKDSASYNGHVYMAVPAMDSIGAIYNLGTLDKQGLKVPETWTELLQFCHDARSKGLYAFGAGFQEGWTAPMPSSALLASSIRDISSYNKALLKGDYDFTSSAPWKETFQKQQEMVSADCFSPSANGTSMDTVVLPGLNQGKYLATVSVGAHIGVLTAPKTGDPSQHYSMRGLPVDDNPDHTNIQAQASNGLMVNKKSKHLDLAMKFVEAWTTESALNKYASALNLTTSLPNSGFKPAESITYVNKAAADGHLLTVLNLPGANLWNARMNAAQGIFAGTMTAQQALESFTTAYAQDTAADKKSSN
jgi:raffinose/stachyose/melibiose transport system substrate-binding protein